LQLLVDQVRRELGDVRGQRVVEGPRAALARQSEQLEVAGGQLLGVVVEEDGGEAAREGREVLELLFGLQQELGSGEFGHGEQVAECDRFFDERGLQSADELAVEEGQRLFD
jgi:hypothetical protein